MTVKTKLPKEDPETVARREAAEARAEAGRIEETQESLSADTRSVIRQFGRLASFAGQPSLAKPADRGGFLNAAQQRSAGSYKFSSLALR